LPVDTEQHQQLFRDYHMDYQT